MRNNEAHYYTWDRRENSRGENGKLIIEDRATTGRFNSSRTLDEATIAELVRLATQAPSAFNLQNWRFIAV